MADEGDESQGGVRFEGWKEIAGFFGKTEKTVQRWESEGLPIRRHMHGRKGSPFMYRAEAEAWLKSRERPMAFPASTDDEDEHASIGLPPATGAATRGAEPDVLDAERMPPGQAATDVAANDDSRQIRPGNSPMGDSATPRPQVPGDRENPGELVIVSQIIRKYRRAIAVVGFVAAAAVAAWYFLGTGDGFKKLGEGGFVGPSEYVEGVGPDTTLNRYLVVEAPSGQQHVQAQLTDRHWQVRAVFGDSATEAGTSFRVFVLVTPATLPNLPIAGPLPPGSVGWFSTVVKLRK